MHPARPSCPAEWLGATYAIRRLRAAADDHHTSPPSIFWQTTQPKAARASPAMRPIVIHHVSSSVLAMTSYACGDLPVTTTFALPCVASSPRQKCRPACDKSNRRANHFRFSEIVSSPKIKNISSLFPKGKSVAHLSPSRPEKRAYHDRSRNVGRVAVDAVVPKRTARERTAKRVVLTPDMLASSSGEISFSGATVARELRLTGRAAL